MDDVLMQNQETKQMGVAESMIRVGCAMFILSWGLIAMILTIVIIAGGCSK